MSLRALMGARRLIGPLPALPVTSQADYLFFSSVLLVLTFLFTAYLQRFSEVFRFQVSSDNRKPGIHVAWTTITYRSVALLIMAGAIVFYFVARFTFPQFTENTVKAGGNVISKLLDHVAGMAPATGTGVTTSQQAHFTALDGTVRVKKSNGNGRSTATTASPWKRATSFRPVPKAWRRLSSMTARVTP